MIFINYLMLIYFKYIFNSNNITNKSSINASVDDIVFNECYTIQKIKDKNSALIKQENTAQYFAFTLPLKHNSKNMNDKNDESMYCSYKYQQFYITKELKLKKDTLIKYNGKEYKIVKDDVKFKFNQECSLKLLNEGQYKNIETYVILHQKYCNNIVDLAEKNILEIRHSSLKCKKFNGLLDLPLYKFKPIETNKSMISRIQIFYDDDNITFEKKVANDIQKIDLNNYFLIHIDMKDFCKKMLLEDKKFKYNTELRLLDKDIKIKMYIKNINDIAVLVDNKTNTLNNSNISDLKGKNDINQKNKSYNITTNNVTTNNEVRNDFDKNGNTKYSILKNHKRVIIILACIIPISIIGIISLIFYLRKEWNKV